MEKIFNWGTTVSKEELIEKINELSNIVLDNTTKDNKLFTEIDKSSFYTKGFPDLFKLTVTNKDGKVYNPDDPNDRVFEVSINNLNLETYELGYNKYCISQLDIKHTSNEIDNRIVNAYLIARMVINIVNDCSAKYKFFVPKECDLYNACYALVEFALYLRIMNIEPERQFSTLIKDIDSSDSVGIQFFYLFAHRLGIPLFTGEKDIFLEQLCYSYYNAYKDSDNSDLVYFELADVLLGPSDKYFKLDGKKIQLVLNTGVNPFLFKGFKEDLDCLLDNGGLQCFKFNSDTKELYEEIGKYSITAEYNTEYKNCNGHYFIHVFDSSLSECNVHGISKGLLTREPLGYIYHTIIYGLLPRTVFNIEGWRGKIMVLPMLEAEFRHMIKNVLK